jgi:hypothetical protein
VEAVENEVESEMKLGKREIKMELRMVSVSVLQDGLVVLRWFFRVHSRSRFRSHYRFRLGCLSLGLTVTLPYHSVSRRPHAVHLSSHLLRHDYQLHLQPSLNEADHPHASTAHPNSIFPGLSFPFSSHLPRISPRNLSRDYGYGCA